jgi:hypothetical protein
MVDRVRNWEGLTYYIKNSKLEPDEYFLKSTMGQFGKACSIAISNRKVVIIFRFKVSVVWSLKTFIAGGLFISSPHRSLRQEISPPE